METLEENNGLYGTYHALKRLFADMEELLRFALATLPHDLVMRRMIAEAPKGGEPQLKAV